MSIGLQSLHITTDWIIAYTQSIESPLQYINHQLIAPVTMPVLFWQSFEPIGALTTDQPVLHGYQRFAYETPIIAGMILDCELTLIDIQQKVGNKHKLTLFNYQLIGYEEKQLIFTSNTTLIQVGDANAEADYS